MSVVFGMSECVSSSISSTYFELYCLALCCDQGPKHGCNVFIKTPLYF